LVSYLITDPKYYSSDIDTFEKNLSCIYKSHQRYKINLACFRDKTSKNFDLLAKSFVKITNSFNIKTIINSNINIAYKLNANGVHLTSKQFDLIKKAKEKNLYTICSTHTIQEVHKAYSLGADAITYSPIFCSKYSYKEKGIKGLQKLILENIPIDIFALGGIISQEQIKLLEQNNINNFASIRYFL
jgi:thiamine-phosphate pyrophosphorylase